MSASRADACHRSGRYGLAPYVKSSKAVTLSAFVQRPTAPSAGDVVVLLFDVGLAVQAKP